MSDTTELAVQEQHKDKDAVLNVSFTELSRQMFQEDVKLPWYKSDMRDQVDEGLDSIYEIAAAHHVPVFEFVQNDPEYALMCVEINSDTTERTISSTSSTFSELASSKTFNAKSGAIK